MFRRKTVRTERKGCLISDYLAHSPTESHPDGQRLKEHLENTARLASGFCEPFGAAEDGQLCGLYHDVGKYSRKFQKRLRGSIETVDHSSAGAILLFENRRLPAAMCVAGHHAGLADCGTRNDLNGTFMARINHIRKEGIEDFGAWREELPDIHPQGSRSMLPIDAYFYTKMLFSALTDADWLDSEAYFGDRPVELPSGNLEALEEKLNAFLNRWENPQTDLNRRRCQILRAAISHGKDPPGLFSMTVPTGGGKTVASMAFALRHAVRHGMRRVIYVIPFCSILEQTQSVFEAIFGKDSIIAHYSGATFERSEEDEERKAFSAENWDAPIVLTTAVQFFESLYANKPGKSRKLHNIAGSVVIFDEAQMLPVPFMNPCLSGICQLVRNYGCSAVLCTATQPSVEQILNRFLPDRQMRELCPEPKQMYEAFRRVTYTDEGMLSDEELCRQLLRYDQILCIVNSRRQAQALYKALPPDESRFHLSTMMTPHDRRAALAAIRECLRAGGSCRVISTSLIEAGVDVDFPVVYRALAGLDSVIQAGGRCNREGKRSAEESLVHIFRTEAKAPRMLEQNISAAERTLRDHESPDAPETIRDYFQFLLYTLKDEKQLDVKEILADAERLRFRTVAEKFRMIDGAAYTVYIPVGEAAALIDLLRRFGPSRELMRKLGECSVSVYKAYFEQLFERGALEMISPDAGILLDLSLYSRETGLPFILSEQDRAIFI